MFPYLGSLITEDGECTTEFRIRLNRGHAIVASLQKKMEKSQHTDFNEDTTNENAMWSVAMYCCESWTLRKNEETRLDASLDGQHQYVDRPPRGRVNQNDRGQR